MLLDRGANIELQTPVDGQRHQDEPGQGTIRALHIAAGKGDMEMIRLLLNHKGDPNASDISGELPNVACKLDKLNSDRRQFSTMRGHLRPRSSGPTVRSRRRYP